MLDESTEIHQMPTNSACLIVNKVNEAPLFLYRLGLAKLFGGRMMILSTVGRKTGIIHRTPVQFFYHEGKYYALNRLGTQSDWYKNIVAHPQVTIQNGYDTICATARQPQTEQEWEAVHLFLGLSPIGKRLTGDLERYLPSSKENDQDQPSPFIAFEPTQQACPEPLETDLVWAWPLILLALAFQITCCWMYRRNK